MIGNGKLSEELIDRAYRDEAVQIFKNFIEDYLGEAAAEYAKNKCKKDLTKLEWARTELTRMMKEQ